MSTFYKAYGKRTLDFLSSLFGLIILFPFLIIISFLVKLSSKGPIFFKQDRLGKNFISFKIIKFRSMVVNNSANHSLVTSKGDNRITKLGAFLRKYKLDELPQLWNVLKGDMSLVGPRPEVSRYIEKYPNEYNEILSVLPGITDNASIKFRNEEEILNNFQDKETAYVKEIMPKKIELYQQYISSISFFGDIKLIFKTIF